MRVYADGCVHALVLLCQGDRALKVAAVRVARPHVQDSAYARLARTRDRLVAVCVELLAVNVRVGINEHHFMKAKGKRQKAKGKSEDAEPRS